MAGLTVKHTPSAYCPPYSFPFYLPTPGSLRNPFHLTFKTLANSLSEAILSAVIALFSKQYLYKFSFCLNLLILNLDTVLLEMTLFPVLK